MKRIPFLENYFVNKEGEVFSNNRGNKIKKLKQSVCGTQYKRIYLRVPDQKPKTFLVHRLVALTYLPKEEGKDFVNHIDGDKLNNSLENLEWVTSSENLRHAFRTGLKSNTGIGNPKSVLSEGEVREIYYKLSEGSRVIDLSREYGITTSAIGKIKTKSNWQDILKDLPPIKVKPKADRLSENTVRWVCEMLEKGHPCKYIKKLSLTPLSIDAVSDIKRRRCYKHISRTYKF